MLACFEVILILLFTRFLLDLNHFIISTENRLIVFFLQLAIHSLVKLDSFPHVLSVDFFESIPAPKPVDHLLCLTRNRTPLSEVFPLSSSNCGLRKRDIIRCTALKEGVISKINYALLKCWSPILNLQYLFLIFPLFLTQDILYARLIFWIIHSAKLT